MRAIRIATFALIAFALSVPVALPLAWGNERRFTYTYESGVLPAGARELEVWNTARLGRNDFYSRFDQRLEFELGVTNRLQTAFYLNYKAVTAEAMGVRTSTFEFGGISSEWKYKVTDPVANALGFAVYGEVTAAPSELELETKLIFDKRLGKVLLAANIVGELELEFEADATKREIVLEVDLAATYSLTPGFSLGLELRNHNVIPHETWESSALFLGPVLAYATGSWWVALSVLPQLPALKAPGGQTWDLGDHEKVNARLLFAFHL